MPIGGALAIGGALWLLTKVAGKPKTVAPSTQPATTSGAPTVQPQSGGGVDTSKVVTSLITSGVAVVGAVVKGVGGGAAGGAATADAVAEGVAAGFYSSAGIGGFVVLGIILVIIIATDVTNGIIQNIETKNYLERMAALTPPADLATKYFKSFVEAVTTRDDYGRNPQLKLSPDVIRQISLACLWAAGQAWQARNDALVAYYSYLHWTPAEMGNERAASNFMTAYPGFDWLAMIAANDRRSFIDSTIDGATKSIAAGPIAYMLYHWAYPSQPSFDFPIDNSPAGRMNWQKIAGPFTPADLTAAAVKVFGDKLTAVQNEMRFTGASVAVLLATIEGYGGIGISQQAFAQTLSGIFGWPAGWGVFWVTNQSPPAPLESYWLTDPASGIRFELSNTHNDGYIRLSRPGVQIAPSVFSDYAGAGGSINSECVDPNGNITDCTTAANRAAERAAAKLDFAKQRGIARGGSGSGARGGSSLVPWLVGGAAVLFGTGALKSVGFGDVRSRRSRRRK